MGNIIVLLRYARGMFTHPDRLEGAGGGIKGGGGGGGGGGGALMVCQRVYSSPTPFHSANSGSALPGGGLQFRSPPTVSLMLVYQRV